MFILYSIFERYKTTPLPRLVVSCPVHPNLYTQTCCTCVLLLQPFRPFQPQLALHVRYRNDSHCRTPEPRQAPSDAKCDVFVECHDQRGCDDGNDKEHDTPSPGQDHNHTSKPCAYCISLHDLASIFDSSLTFNSTSISMKASKAGFQGVPLSEEDMLKGSGTRICVNVADRQKRNPI